MASGRIPRIDAVVPHRVVESAQDVPSAYMDVAGRGHGGIDHSDLVYGDGPGIHEATEIQLLEAQSEPPVAGYAHQKPYRVACGDHGFAKASALPFELSDLLGIPVFRQNIVEGARGHCHHLQIAQIRMEQRRGGSFPVEEVQIGIDDAYHAPIPAAKAHLPDGALRIVPGVGDHQTGPALVYELAVETEVCDPFDDHEHPIEDIPLQSHQVGDVVRSQMLAHHRPSALWQDPTCRVSPAGNGWRRSSVCS